MKSQRTQITHMMLQRNPMDNESGQSAIHLDSEAHSVEDKWKEGSLAGQSKLPARSQTFMEDDKAGHAFKGTDEAIPDYPTLDREGDRVGIAPVVA